MIEVPCRGHQARCLSLGHQSVDLAGHLVDQHLGGEFIGKTDPLQVVASGRGRPIPMIQRGVAGGSDVPMVFYVGGAASLEKGWGGHHLNPTGFCEIHSWRIGRKLPVDGHLLAPGRVDIDSGVLAVLHHLAGNLMVGHLRSGPLAAAIPAPVECVRILMQHRQIVIGDI